MALTPGTRNLLTLALLVVGFVLFQLGADRFRPIIYEHASWAEKLTVLAISLFLLGAACFFAFAGGFWTRTILTTMVPFLTQGVLELTVGSDPAYPQILLLLALPFAALFFVGAVFIGGPYLVWRDSRRRAI